MIVSDNTKHAEGLGKFFNNFWKLSPEAGKKQATIVMKNPGRGLEIGAKFGSAAGSKKIQKQHCLRFRVETVFIMQENDYILETLYGYNNKYHSYGHINVCY